MKKCFQAKGVCTITAHTPLSATLVWQLSHYLFRETCFMNSYPKAAAFLRLIRGALHSKNVQSWWGSHRPGRMHRFYENFWRIRNFPNGPTEAPAPTPKLQYFPYPVGADDSVRLQDAPVFPEILGEFAAAHRAERSSAPCQLRSLPGSFPVDLGTRSRQITCARGGAF